MATNVYDPCPNPISGEMFRMISFNEDTCVMQWTVEPTGHVPFEHVHLNQDETFEVHHGELKVMIDGNEHIVKEGSSITVPKGIRHIAFNNAAEKLDCTLTYTPGLDYDAFMQCFMGLTNDGLLDKKGGIDIPKMGYFLVKMKARCMARPTAIPAPVFNIALRVFYIRGILSGWSKLYQKYTDKA